MIYIKEGLTKVINKIDNKKIRILQKLKEKNRSS
jgi:hypothetical protein